MELVVNAAVRSCCGSPGSECSCHAGDQTQNAFEPLEASILAADRSHHAEHLGMREQALDAVTAAGKGDNETAERMHLELAQLHDDQAAAFGEAGKGKERDKHWRAAAFHGKAAAAHGIARALTSRQDAQDEAQDDDQNAQDDAQDQDQITNQEECDMDRLIETRGWAAAADLPLTRNEKAQGSNADLSGMGTQRAGRRPNTGYDYSALERVEDVAPPTRTAAEVLGLMGLDDMTDEELAEQQRQRLGLGSEIESGEFPDTVRTPPDNWRARTSTALRGRPVMNIGEDGEFMPVPPTLNDLITLNAIERAEQQQQGRRRHNLLSPQPVTNRSSRPTWEPPMPWGGS
jgi:hypothetical protein